MFNYYGMEEDQDIDESITINDETAIDDDEVQAMNDDVVDVSDISEDQAAHNEAASAGGVSTGSNQDQLLMDPVAATESYIFRRFGLSLEDIEDANEQTAAEADEIVAEADELAEEDDPAITTVNVIVPEGGETEVVPAVAPDPVDEPIPVDVPIETASDIAAVENLRRILSFENEDVEDGDGDADVEFDVRTPNNDVNFQMEDKAITIEPNSDTETEYDGGDDEDDFGGDEGSEEDGEGGDEGGEGESPETSGERWYF